MTTVTPQEVATADRATPRWIGLAAAVVILLGGFFRIRRYWAARSLWVDEAWLALNVLTRSFAGLTHRLDFEQTAPVPFLWSTRASMLAFGHGEMALRLPAMVAGCLLVIVSWPVARRVLGPRWGLVSLGMISASPALIYFSDDLKPYAGDALVMGVLLWLTLRLIDRQARRDWILLGLGGFLSLLASFSAAFVLAPVVVAIALALDLRRDRASQRAIGACGLAWAVAAFGSWLTLRQGAWSPYMRRYWSNGYLGTPGPHLAHRLWELGTKSLQQDIVAMHAPLPGVQTLLILLILGAGTVGLARRAGSWMTTLIAGPFGLVTVASIFRRFPFSGRTLLFLMPCFLLLMPEAMRALAEWGGRGKRVIAALGAGLIVLPGLVTSVRRVFDPFKQDDFRPVYEAFVKNHAPGTPVYIYARGLPAWTFYSTDWDHPDRERLRMLFAIGQSDGPAFDNAPSRAHRITREGDGLIWHAREGTEIYGIATGAELGSIADRPWPYHTDPGWAENEARRIREAARPDAWVLFTHAIDTGEGDIMTTLTREGGTVAEIVRGEGAAAYLVRFQ